MGDRHPTSMSVFAQRCALAFLALAVMPMAAAGAANEPASKDGKNVLPGKIYIAVPLPRDVMHGLLAVDPNDRTCVTVDEFASYSYRVAPGGRRIAFGMPDRDARTITILTRDSDRGQEPVQIFDRPGVLSWTSPAVLSWASSGKELIVSLVGRGVGPDEPTNWRVKADGSGREKLAIPATELIWDWSSDGESLLSSSARGAEGEQPRPAWPYHALYAMRIDGSNATLLVPAGEAAKAGRAGVTINAGVVGPRFSPDGREVVYIRSTSEIEARRFVKRESKVWIVRRDGKDRRLVFDGNEEEGYPSSAAWAPDGKSLAIGLQKLFRDEAGLGSGSEARLLIMDADGKNPREIPLPHPTLMTVVDWR